jgi:hypothetical protein
MSTDAFSVEEREKGSGSLSRQSTWPLLRLILAAELSRMYRLRTKGGKRDPVKQWRLPDRVLFACGACHVLAYAFLKTYPGSGFTPIWIRPAKGYTGNHILVVRDQLAFDYHGYSDWASLLTHMSRKANRWWPGWDAELIELPQEVLVSESRSRTYDGLWLKEPKQFLFDALPRAERFLKQFPPPPLAPVLGAQYERARTA